MRRLATIALALLVAAAIASPAAAGAFGVSSESWSTNSPDGEFVRQAGAHPDLVLDLAFAERPGTEDLDGNVRDIDVSLPPGFVGNPTVGATCPVEDVSGFEGLGGANAYCPPESQIGLVEFNKNPGGQFRETVPLYNLTPEPGQPALFAFNYLGVDVRIKPRVNSATDYSLSARTAGIPQATTIYALTVTLWGVPADPAHDAARFSRSGAPGAPSGATPQPFLSLPTRCEPAPLGFGSAIDSWQDPTTILSSTTTADATGIPFAIEGCEDVPFAPAARVATSAGAAASPTGLDFDLSVPQSEAPNGLATAHVRRVELALPEGVAISPAGAEGLGACTSDQVGLGVEAAASCPDSSKLGTVAIETPLLAAPLTGSLFLAQPHANPFGSLLALYLVAEGQGVRIKLAGRVSADPGTGRITAVFDETPQLPFGDLHVVLREGPRAPLATPLACGTPSATTSVGSWASSVPVRLDSAARYDQGCPGAFAPSLEAGVENPHAGASSSFSFAVRAGGSGELRSLRSIELPEGLLGRVGSVPLCGEAQAANGTCPGDSRIGRVEVSAGSGPSPLRVPQPGKSPTAVYLTGPYDGAPYGLSVVVPAQAGPFDLGTVVVRIPLRVDQTTADLGAEIAESRVFDPSGSLRQVIAGGVPTILEGIPLRLSELRLLVDRPGFLVNPTDCSAGKIDAMAEGGTGATAPVSVPFQAADCAALEFAPRLSARILDRGRKSARRNFNPKVRFTLSSRPGEANLARAAVALPRSVFLDQSHIGTVCTRPQLAAGSCPAASVYGYAQAVSPLLGKPLEGPVYLASSDHKLPDLVVALEGEVKILLRARIDTAPHGGIRSTFETVPDVPVSRFTLTLEGGRRGLLVNSTNLCDAPARATATFLGQNGKREVTRPRLRTAKGVCR